MSYGIPAPRPGEESGLLGTWVTGQIIVMVIVEQVFDGIVRYDHFPFFGGLIRPAVQYAVFTNPELPWWSLMPLYPW